jgi:anti-anti-sigma regulatory factor
MADKVEAKPGKGEIILEGDLTIANTHDILTLLREGLGDERSGVITIGEVEDIDLSCLQLICSFHRAAVVAGRKLVLNDSGSPVFRAFRRDAGFERHQGCKWNPDKTCLWMKESNNE